VNGAPQFKVIYLARRNPSVKAEDWPRAWRSHAAYAGQFPIIWAEFSSIFYCARVLQPSLDGVPFDPPAAARDYDGVALVSSPTADGLPREMPPEVAAKIDEDELRVFNTYVRNFSFRCREVLVHGGAPDKAAVMRLLARKNGTSPEEFFAHWNGSYADNARRAADASGTVVRYVQNRVLEEPPTGYPFDAVTETWFASTEHAARSFVDGALAPLARELSAFCDLERSVTLLTSVIFRLPRA
jgi:EthD domain